MTSFVAIIKPYLGLSSKYFILFKELFKSALSLAKNIKEKKVHKDKFGSEGL